MFRFEGRHLAVVPTLNLFAEHEGDAAGAMIGPGAIVADTTTKLREHQQDHVVGVIVLAKVLHEGIDALGHGAPQITVAGVLAGVGVEGAVITVEDPAAQIGQMHLRDTLELPGNRGVGILHRR